MSNDAHDVRRNGLVTRIYKAFRREAKSAEKRDGAAEVLPSKLPRHVAIIMDGNGRWAEGRGLPRTAGHYAGAEALRGIIQASDDWHIEALTIYAFSTENWARPQEEVSALMALMLKLFTAEIDELHAKHACIRIIGDIEGLPGPQRDIVKKAMERTKDNKGLKLNVALNYGGRQELLSAAKAMAARVSADEMLNASEADFSMGLYTYGLPDVDLLIRTSGERRISNFLLWQAAYAELIFNDVMWPDYTREIYLRDLHEFAARDRRFGKVKV